MNDARDKLNLHFSMLGLKGAPFLCFPIFLHLIIFTSTEFMCASQDQVQHWYEFLWGCFADSVVTSLNIFEPNLWRFNPIRCNELVCTERVSLLEAITVFKIRFYLFIHQTYLFLSLSSKLLSILACAQVKLTCK